MNQEDSKKLFLAIYDEHADAIFRFCTIKTSNTEVAHDLTQDVFMRFWETIKQKGSVAYPKAYLFTIARNAVIDWYRKHKTDSLDHMLEEGFAPHDEDVISIEVSAEFRQAMRTLKKLDPKHQEVLTLRFVEGLPPKEIANILDETTNTISVRINRAVKALQDALQSHE